MSLLSQIKEINEGKQVTAFREIPELKVDNRLKNVTNRVFNPNFIPVTTFIDCNTRRTYCQIGDTIEYYEPERIEGFVEPRAKE